MTVCMTYPCRRTTGGCPVCDPPALHPMYMPLPAQQPMGCICPPTSEKTCESGICPRKNHLRAGGAVSTPGGSHD